MLIDIWFALECFTDNYNLKFSYTFYDFGLDVALVVQLKCIACGCSWSASRDAVSLLTLDASDSKENVGTAPWATRKLDVGKKPMSSHESDKTNDIFMPPLLETQKSFGKSRKD